MGSAAHSAAGAGADAEQQQGAQRGSRARCRPARAARWTRSTSRWCAAPTGCRARPRTRAGPRTGRPPGTAAARASDPRRLFRNQTERKLACLVRTPIAPDSEAARRSAMVPSGCAPYQPRRRAAIVSGSARRVAIRASATRFRTHQGDRLRVEGVPGGDLYRVEVAVGRRPVVGGGGLALPVQRGEVRRRAGCSPASRSPVWPSTAAARREQVAIGAARPGPGPGARRSRRRPARYTTRATGPRWPGPGRPWPARPAGTACWRTRVISWCLASWQRLDVGGGGGAAHRGLQVGGQGAGRSGRGRAQPVARGRRRDRSTAAVETAEASHQPASRSGIMPTVPGVATGST